MSEVETPSVGLCPEWCVVVHDPSTGEDGLVHVGAPLAIADELLARICMSIDPRSQVQDGPYVVAGWTELTLEEVETLGGSLIALARSARATHPPAAGRTRSSGP